MNVLELLLSHIVNYDLCNHYNIKLYSILYRYSIDRSFFFLQYPSIGDSDSPLWALVNSSALYRDKGDIWEADNVISK
jgi:hypothetical protein